MKPISSISSLAEYVETFSAGLARKVADQCEPLYNPDRDGLHPRLGEIKTKPFPAQAAKITAQVRCLKENGLIIDAGKMGTGKTCQAISSAHCLFDGKPYRALVMCPSHLVKKWVAEVHKFLGGGVQATIIEDWEEFIAIPREKPKHPTWYIMAQTTAKLGYPRRAATVVNRKRKMTDAGMVNIEVECCPKCDYPAHKRGGMLADRGDVERLQLKCCGAWCKSCGKSIHHDLKECPTCDGMLRPCGEPLTQAHGHKISPAQYAKAVGLRIFDVFVRDEAHNSKSGDSIDGHACSVFAALARYRIMLTGTLLAGKSEDLRPLLFRLMPRPFVQMGFGWKSELPFAEQYGRIQTTIRKSSGGYDVEKKKQGKGSKGTCSTSRDVKPGILPQLFPHFVANVTTFMSIHDLATDLPSYTEETIPVQMDPLMFEVYEAMQKELLAAFRACLARDRKEATKILGPMLETLMTWPDVPYGRKPVYVGTEHFFIPPTMDRNGVYPTTMDRNGVYPKEKELLRVIKEEKAQRRQVWVYSDRNDTQERLVNYLESNGLKVGHLEAKVKPSSRIEWLETFGPKIDVGVCNPSLVETGMELFGPGFNFATLAWYSTGWRLNTLRQASMRSFRIGQTIPCRTLYFYYQQSAQEKAIGIMASKLVAAEAIEGKFSDQGLANESVDEDIAMEVARCLAEKIEVHVRRAHNPIAAGCSQADRVAMLRKQFAEYQLRKGGKAS